VKVVYGNGPRRTHDCEFALVRRFQQVHSRGPPSRSIHINHIYVCVYHSKNSTTTDTIRTRNGREYVHESYTGNDHEPMPARLRPTRSGFSRNALGNFERADGGNDFYYCSYCVMRLVVVGLSRVQKPDRAFLMMCNPKNTTTVTTNIV